MKKVLVVLAVINAAVINLSAQAPPFKNGIVEDEFVYDAAPFPQCHAATVAETPKGLVSAFFGGTEERNPDVEIYVCRRDGEKWTKPLSVATGIQNGILYCTRCQVEIYCYFIK